MNGNRRKKSRRHADRILEEVVDILRILQRVSGGEKVDFTEHYADLVGRKNDLGRRDQDRKLGEALCSAIEGIASNINKLLEKEKPLRKVKITKVKGKEGAQVDVQASFVGWEEQQPRVGMKYRILKEDGGLFLSGLVTRVTPDYFQTTNSLYHMEILLEDRRSPFSRQDR